MPNITANGTVTLTLLSGRIYTIAAGGTFGGGSLAAELLLDDDTAVPITGFPITAAASIVFPASSTRVRLTLTGSTSPDISYAVTLATGNTPASIGAPTIAEAARAIETKTAAFTAVIGGRYIVETGSIVSITDPAGTTAGQSYEVWIGSGTIWFNGAGTVYSASRFSIRRRYNGSAWVTPTPTLTDSIPARVTTITSSSTPTVNTDLCDAVTITALAAAITSMTSGLTGTPKNFDMLLFRIKDNGTARAITWGASFAAAGASLPTTTVLSKVLHALFIWDSVAAKWCCLSTSQEA